MPLSPLITRADLEERLGVAEVARYERSNATAVNDACAFATDRFRSEASRIFTLESIDALTPATITREPRYHIISDACDILSAGSARPDFIDKKAAEAAQWRTFLALGKVPIDPLVRIGSGGGSIAFAGRTEARVFARTSDGSGAFDQHDPTFN
jgi:hypothetical protein